MCREKKRSFKNTERSVKRRWALSGSFTVEASLVMSVVLFVIAFVLQFGLELHDAATGSSVLNEAMELQSRLPKEHGAESESEILAYASERLEGMLSQKRMKLELTEEKNGGSSGSVRGAYYYAELKDRGFRPEIWMRRLTLLDPLAE